MSTVEKLLSVIGILKNQSLLFGQNTFKQGNPVCLNFQWVQRVAKAVPSLLYMDGRAITEDVEETEAAEETAPQKLESQPKSVDQPENLDESTLPNDTLSVISPF